MSRQERELIEALDRARRCAGRLESRARLRGDELLSLQARHERESQHTSIGVFRYLHRERAAA